MAAVGGEIDGALGQLAGLSLLAVLERLGGLACDRVPATRAGVLGPAALDLFLEPLPGCGRPLPPACPLERAGQGLEGGHAARRQADRPHQRADGRALVALRQQITTEPDQRRDALLRG